MALTDPVPSQAIDVFKRNMEDSDRFVNQTSGTVTNRTGKAMRPLPVISDDIEQQITDLTADINAAKEDLYPIVKFRFLVDTYEITNRNELGDTATGETYRYIGATLPFNVTPAINPVGNPDFVQVIQTDHNNLTNRNAAGSHDEIYSRNFKTVADLRSQTDASGNTINLALLVGSKVFWRGYYAESDGGGNCGIVKVGDSTSLVDDGGSIFVIVNDVTSGVWVEANLKGQRLNIKKFGVFGGANYTTQMQRALNYGIKDLKIPRGVYEFDHLTLPDYVNLEGVTAQAGVGGGDRIVEFRFNLTDTSNAITCGAEPTLKKIIFVNNGGSYNELTKTLTGTSSGGIKLQDNITMEDCAFYLWHQCVRTGPSTFYMNTNRVEFNRCTSGYVCEDTSPYNMNIYSPKSSLTEYFIVGIGSETPRDVKVFGGAIEGYTSAFIRCIDLSLFGVYFETVPERSAFSVIDPQLNNTRVSMFGCTIFVNHTSRFINASGIENVSITAAGNTYTGVATSEFIPYYLPVSGSMNIGGDSADPNIAPNFRYVSSITQAAELGGITMPRLPATAPEYYYSGVNFLGKSGAIQKTWTVEPTIKVSGQQFLADGDGWDPLALAQGRPYFVIWQGDRWRSVSG